MDEVRIVKHRTHIWPVIIALVILAIIIGYVLFAMNGPASQVGWNGSPHTQASGIGAQAAGLGKGV